MVNAMIGQLITEDDCGTTGSIELPVSSKDILGRYCAENISGVISKNELIEPDEQARLKKAGIVTVKVRSTLKCEAAHGYCTKCYGVDENFKPAGIGTNIGVTVAQGISEPATQLTLGAVHSGGAAKVKMENSFERTNQIFSMPHELPFKATLAENTGVVTEIKPAPAGGKFVYVSGKEHYVKQDMPLVVKKGDTVQKGDRLSEGNIKQQELLKLKGMDSVRNYMVDELKKVFDDNGQNVMRKFFETSVRSTTNTTRVNDPGDHEGLSSGDYAQLNMVEKLNKDKSPISVPVKHSVGRNLFKDIGPFVSGTPITGNIMNDLKAMGLKSVDVKKKPIVHTPTLRPLEFAPLSTYDWMSRLNSRNLMDTLTMGTSEGWTSDIHGYNPIPAYVFGTEFGKGMEGRY